MANHPVVVVSLRPECSNSSLLQVAREVVARLDARVIGIAAWQPTPVDWTVGDYVPRNFPGAESSDATAAVSGAETEFRRVFVAPEIEWHSSLSFAPPSSYVVQQVAGADLVLTGTPALDGSNTAQTIACSLVMKSGRPIIIVPESIVASSLDRVMVAWRNTPESRRAVLGALPLLQRATEVTVVGVASAETLPAARHELVNASHWMAGHAVRTKIIGAIALNDVGKQLVGLAREIDANLIVAGAYGHSRLREWAFGGVSRYLLQQTEYCVLFSH